jgi:formylglycine-generating enzyme required for sulfatase activity
MSPLTPLIAFALRQAVAEPDDRIADFLARRLDQVVGPLPTALAYAADRTWRGLAAALVLDGVLNRLRATDAAEALGLQEQLRRFSDLAAGRFHHVSEEVRLGCLAELRSAQVEERGQLELLGASELTPLMATHWRYEDPTALLAAAGRAEGQVAGALTAKHPRLAQLLGEKVAGAPFLVSLFAYFFRREIEANDDLSGELQCDGLRHLSGPQVRALAGLAQALARLGSRFDAMIDELLEGKPRRQTADVCLTTIHPFQAAKLGRRRGLSGIHVLHIPEPTSTPPPALQQIEPRRPGDALVNALGMRFVWVPPGRFVMGSSTQEPSRDTDEKRHEVQLTRGFFLGAHPVTRGQFASFVRAARYVTEAEGGGGAHRGPSGEWKLDPWCNWRHPGFPQDDDHPVVCVSWNDVQAFCSWLAGEKKPLEGVCRLPTEAEWEHACRAGTTTAYWCGDALSPAQSNYNGATEGSANVFHDGTTPVWVFPPNPWGLYDMHGNLWEWCADWYGPYPAAEVVDPQGPRSGRNRVLRGGSWRNQARFLRSAARNQLAPTGRDRDAGFRVCLFL